MGSISKAQYNNIKLQDGYLLTEKVILIRWVLKLDF